MTEWNLTKLIPWILESGRLALSYFDHPSMEFKADQSIVTQADKAVEAFLTSKLNHPSEGSYLLGEETIAQQTESYLADAFRHTAWVVDPIDGTAPFANNLPTWGVSIGMMTAGVLREGIVLLPVLGELYYSEAGKTYCEKLGSEPDLWESRLGVRKTLSGPTSPELSRGSMVSLSQQLARRGSYGLPFYVQVTGSAVFNMVRLAAGSYSALVTRFKIWDFAACIPMLTNLGWTMEFHNSGKDFGLVMDDSAIISQPGDPERWSSLDHVIFAPSRQAADFVRQNTHFDE